ncbi:hypothetical protein HJFPF1_01276 [Paramyrothecium foliicola]|nr:hypothetical protein HJFPF1_01276 [Paramyrothecium foliicola]
MLDWVKESSQDKPIRAVPLTTPLAEDGDGLELEDFSYIHPHAGCSPDRSIRNRRQFGLLDDGAVENFLVEAKSRPRSEYEKAASDWETVRDDDDFSNPQSYASRVKRRGKAFEIVFETRPNIQASRSRRPGLPRRNTILGPPDVSLPRLPDSAPYKWMNRQYSIASSSSFYSDSDHAEWLDENVLLRLGMEGSMRLNNDMRQTTSAVDRLRQGDAIVSCSKTSSSASADRFKYDGGAYSAFLKPSAETEISRAINRLGDSRDFGDIPPEHLSLKNPSLINVDNAVKVPVLRHSDNAGVAEPQAESCAISIKASMVKGKHDFSAEGDWQTVTTDQSNDLTDTCHSNHANIAGDSFMYESKYCETHARQGGLTTSPRMIRHPPQQSGIKSYGIRNDKQTHRPMLVPRFTGVDGNAFPQDSSRARAKTTHHTAAIFRKLSSSFRIGNVEAQESPVVELDALGASYVSLGSDASENQELARGTAAAKVEKTENLGTSDNVSTFGPHQSTSPAPLVIQKVRHNVGLELPKGSKVLPCTAGEGHSYEYYQLPFPLVSLSEAAVRQHSRRVTGEEDHTDPGGSFASRRGTRTISTVSSSNCPRTPLSARFNIHADGSEPSITVPAPVHKAVSMNRHSMSNVTGLRQSSSAILKMPDSTDTSPRLDLSWDSKTRIETPPLLSPRFLRLRGLTASHRETSTGAGYRGFSAQSIFSPSENDLIELAREDILFRRRHTDNENGRLRAIFITTVVLSTLFPPVGMLALLHKLDSTISWYTKGGLHCLTERQRMILKLQLLSELVLYPVMITVLVVYYSLHH